MVGQQAFGAGRQPFHRTADLLGGPQRHAVVRERAALQAEAAADIGRDHADLALGAVEDVRQLHPHAVRVLRAGVERVLIVGLVVVADGDARLHRVRRKPVVLDAQP